MWIRCTNPATRRLFNDDVMDEPVTFNENGKARVTRETGEAMVQHYDQIEHVDSDSEDNE